jgi:hypothetical protein
MVSQERGDSRGYNSQVFRHLFTVVVTTGAVQYLEPVPLGLSSG